MSDLRYLHATTIHVVEVFDSEKEDLIAIGGEHSVEVLHVTATNCTCIAIFHVGCRITALAWSNNTASPSTTDDWSLELTAAGSESGLFQLTKTSQEIETIFQYGGGLSGHHGRVNSIVYCGGRGEDSTRYVATVSDDKMLMVWDLQPTLDIPSIASSPFRTGTPNSPTQDRLQPTAYVIPFPYPLVCVASHPSSSKEFLVADSRGSIFLTDWRSDPHLQRTEENKSNLEFEAIDADQENWRHSSVVELIDPTALSDACMGFSVPWSGSVAWRATPERNIIGGISGGKFNLWDLHKLGGGNPYVSGPTFAQGGKRFRWCRTYPEYFAISAASSSTIAVHTLTFPLAPPTPFVLAGNSTLALAPGTTAKSSSKGQFIRDFDFLASVGIPRIAAAVGRGLIIFAIGEGEGES